MFIIMFLYITVELISFILHSEPFHGFYINPSFIILLMNCHNSVEFSFESLPSLIHIFNHTLPFLPLKNIFRWLHNFLTSFWYLYFYSSLKTLLFYSSLKTRQYSSLHSSRTTQVSLWFNRWEEWSALSLFLLIVF